MIPVFEELPIDDDWSDDDSDTLDDVEEKQMSSLTYKLDPDTLTISTMPTIDDVESVKQACMIMLNTMRGEHAIYDENYGTEITDLIGDPVPLAYAEVESDIKDTLTQDDRVESVDDFRFYSYRGAVIVTFTVTTNVGGSFQEGVTLNG